LTKTTPGPHDGERRENRNREGVERNMGKPTVLFLCTGNSARSQMAEALLRHRAGDRFEAHSAGTEPKGVNPLTIRVLEEIGVSTDGLRSKGVKEFLGRMTVRHMIVVCSDADKKCPTTWPGMVNRQFWPFDDPAAAEGTEEERLSVFRAIRDQIDARLKAWIAETKD
jgi:arsenate reductase (thioredoxin)